MKYLNNSFLYLIALIVIVLSDFSCTINQSINSILISDIVKSRNLAIKIALRDLDVYEYKILRKKGPRVLSNLAEVLAEYSFDLNVEVVHIIDNYDSGSDWYGGLLWSQNGYLEYHYELRKDRIEVVHSSNDFNDYRHNAIIDPVLFEYLKIHFLDIDFNNIPASGRSNNGYCVYSIIDRNNSSIKSYAFRQW